MTQTADVALIAQKWVNIVQSCCPGVARAEWHVNRGDVVIRGWFKPRGSKSDDGGLQEVEIAVNHRTVADYIHAPEAVQFHANGQLIDFVTFGWLSGSSQGGHAGSEGAQPKHWRVDSVDLGLQAGRDSRQRWWSSHRPVNRLASR